MRFRRTIAVCAAAGFLLSCSSNEGGNADTGDAGGASVEYAGARQDLGGVTVLVPEAWSAETPSSQMRVAQYRLPGNEGDAELAVFYFGATNAGSVSANLDRWRGQMKGDDPGTVTNRTVNGMPVTELDVSGTYQVTMGPMVGGSPPAADYRMVASIVESTSGAFYFKLTGPAATVAAWRETFTGFVNSSQQG